MYRSSKKNFLLRNFVVYLNESIVKGDGVYLYTKSKKKYLEIYLDEVFPKLAGWSQLFGVLAFLTMIPLFVTSFQFIRKKFIFLIIKFIFLVNFSSFV